MDVSEQDVLVMAENLAGGIQIPTISYEEGSFEAEALNDLNKYIEETYPSLHSESHVKWEIVHDYREAPTNEYVSPFIGLYREVKSFGR